MKCKLKMLVIMLLAVFFVGGAVALSAEQEELAKPEMSSKMIHVYGRASVDGRNIAIGSVVKAFDSSGTLCGRFDVTSPGYFGLMNIFLDDPETPVDEGADPGEVISISIDGQSAGIMSEVPLKWTKDGDTINIDLIIGPPDAEGLTLILAEIVNQIQVRLTFNEAIDDQTGGNCANYVLEDQAGNKTQIHRAIVQDNACTVLLLTEALQESILYTVTARQTIKDVWSNPLDAEACLICSRSNQ